MASTRRRFLAHAGRVAAFLLGMPPLARAQERARAIHEETRNTLRGAIGAELRELFEGSRERAHEHPGLPRVALPPPERTPARPLATALAEHAPAAGFAPDAIPLARLSRLLHFTNGVTARTRRGVPLRAAPSAGALYAGEVYLVAERVDGLEPGVYAYLPLEKRLARIAGGSRIAAVAASLEEPGRAHRAACAVLLTNVFGRYRVRYANRGYRYALIDTGHLGENLRLTAASAGLAEWGPLRFQDAALDALLGIDGADEAVCAVHFVGVRGAAPRPGEAARAVLVEAARRGTSNGPVSDPPQRYHRATALVPSTEAASGSAPDAANGVREEGNARVERPPAHPLPEPRAPEMRVERAIAVRRSTRRFLPKPVSARDLAFAVRAAAGHAGLRRADGVSLLLFVHDADGVPPGLYRVDSAGTALLPLRRGSQRDALVKACLRQAMAGTAAAAFAMVGAVTEASRRGGDRAYRDLCIEAGAIGQRIYLAAESLGLTARNLGAFYDDDLNALCDLDGRDHAVLHLTLLGSGD